MKPVVGLIVIAAVLGATFYLYTALSTGTGAEYADASTSAASVVMNPIIPQIPQNQGR